MLSKATFLLRSVKLAIKNYFVAKCKGHVGIKSGDSFGTNRTQVCVQKFVILSDQWDKTLQEKDQFETLAVDY